MQVGTSSLKYNANNMLLTMDENGFVYDADGNMVSGVLSSKDMKFEYDSQNRLIKADGETYAYDPEGIRISKTSKKETLYIQRMP